MQIDIKYGQQNVQFDVEKENLLDVKRSGPLNNLADPVAAVREALENPFEFPPLRRALTPEDQVTIVVDETIPQLPRLLVPLLEHLLSARISPEAITLLCLPPSTSQPWLDDLPDEFLDVRVEVHNPHERKKLSYLASTKNGRRIYLNRSAVDADQLIVFTRRAFDPIMGYTGGETDIFPALGDEATRREMAKSLSPKLQEEQNPVREEAKEVTWLLGAPFFVQIVEGDDNEVAHVLGGTQDSCSEGLRLWKKRWAVQVPQRAEVVVASLGCLEEQRSFTEMAHALVCASRVVEPEGVIVLLTEATPDCEPFRTLFQEAFQPQQVIENLLENPLPNGQAALCWAGAASQAHIYLLSRLPEDVTEDLYATHLENASQVQKLLGKKNTCVFLPEANKIKATLKNGKV